MRWNHLLLLISALGKNARVVLMVFISYQPRRVLSLALVLSTVVSTSAHTHPRLHTLPLPLQSRPMRNRKALTYDFRIKCFLPVLVLICLWLTVIPIHHATFDLCKICGLVRVSVTPLLLSCHYFPVVDPPHSSHRIRTPYSLSRFVMDRHVNWEEREDDWITEKRETTSWRLSTSWKRQPYL
ncbi:hypothetical protein J3A83DRAFT_1156286 [Scleroderma citrinum]